MSKVEAVNAHKRGDVFKAERKYLEALREEFDPYLASNLGMIYIQKDEPGRAREWLEKAHRIAPDLDDAANNLGMALKKLNRIGDAIRHFESLARHTEHSLNNLGTCYLEIGEIEKARDTLIKARLKNKKNPHANWNLGLANLNLHEWDKGWEGYEYGFMAAERKPRPCVKVWPEWNGEKGKTVFIWGEQGVGDEILFANCFNDVIRDSKQVLIECHPRLEGVFRRSFPKAAIYGTRKSPDYDWVDPYQIDYQIPMGSLPRLYRRKDEDFPEGPYLKPNPERVEYWKRKYPGPRIGLSWRGGSQKTSGSTRSFELERMLPFFQNKATFLSLQYTDCFPEIDAMRRFGIELPHEEAAIENLEEQFNLVAACDLVISVITAVVHVAGSIGIETWCLVPQGVSGAAWKFTGDKNIWHPSVRHYRQKNRYEWEWTVGEVNKDLKNWLRALD